VKTGRLELRLAPELRAKLEALADLSGRSASATVRRLIIAAHRDAFGDRRPSPSTAPDVRRAPAQTAPAAEPDDPCDFMTTDEVLAMAGIDLGAYPAPEGNDELTSAPVTTTSTEAGP
jgi:hypothetical protein